MLLGAQLGFPVCLPPPKEKHVYIHIYIYMYILVGLDGNIIGAEEPNNEKNKNRKKSMPLNSLVKSMQYNGYSG